LSHNLGVTPREVANSICDALIRNGHQALLVGGCVRDLLLGREPADYDVTTDARPERVMQLFPQSVAVGAQFGVVLIPSDGHKVEVATFRSDVGYSDGRHPDSVVYSKTPQEDVQRRDFTINGLLMRHGTGEVLDFVEGLADLRSSVIRAIGDPDRRFSEDKLRMLRAVRFSARFRFSIEPATFAAIRSHAAEILQVSAERVRDELTKLLTEGSARRGFELLDESGLLEQVLPEVVRMKGVGQPPQYHPEGDVWIHTRMMIEGLPSGASPALAWGVLLHDVGKPPTFRSAAVTGDRIRFDGHAEVGSSIASEICRRLHFSNDETGQILALIANHMRFKDVTSMRSATLKRFVRLPYFGEHLALHKLDCLSSHRRLDAYDFVQSFLASTPPEQVRPPKLLSGDDLKSLGYAPGPLFSNILQALEDAQLDSQVGSREEAVRFLQRQFPLNSIKGTESR
jgi:tRNA nucleotidyltransferase/poly(A) polymerase